MRNLLLGVFLLIFSVEVPAYDLCSGDNSKSLSQKCAQEDALPRWTPQTLNGTVSLHDGPNCFNAALASAGYIDELVYIDSTEYRYYLEEFCHLQSQDSDKPGELLAFEYPDKTILHGALNLGHGFIFEKISTAGSLGHSSKRQNRASFYSIKRKNLSPYIGGEDSKMVYAVHNYSCENPLIVRKKISQLSSDPTISAIRKVRLKMMEKVSHRSISSLTDMATNLKNLAETIDHRQGNSSEDVYILALGKSLVGHCDRIADELNRKLDSAFLKGIDDLKLSVNNLSKKIEAHTSDPAILRILNEDRPR